MQSAEPAISAEAARLRRRLPSLRAVRRWILSVGSIDRPGVIARVDANADWSGRYVFMVLMSAGIAVFGLLQSSPAVVIGAMLISPLMGPIVALGFAFAIFDWRDVGRSLATLLGGSALAVAFCALVVWVSPLREATPEILARTRPNLFDLFIAVFAALAGTYATIRQQGETIVGVAIATALMPPLATVGYGLATAQWAIATGATALYVTNFVAIALSAAILAKLFGFSSSLSPNQTRLQTLLISAVLIALAVPLGVALGRIGAEEATASRVRRAIADYFAPGGHVVRLDFNFAPSPPTAFAVVTTDRYRPDGANEAARAAQAAAGAPFAVTVNQIVVGSEVARLGESAVARLLPGLNGGNDVAGTVAAVAGIPPETVMLDRASRRASAEARFDPAVDLAGWRALEARLNAANPGWIIELEPPLEPLAPVPFAPDAAALSPDAIAAVDLTAWALTRWNAARVVAAGQASHGEPESLALERASAVVEMLRARGIQAEALAATETGEPEVTVQLVR